MPRKPSLLDDQVSQYLDPLNIGSLAFSLSRAHLFSLIELTAATQQTITIPELANLPRSIWPIGGCATFFPGSAVTHRISPAAGVTLNGASANVDLPAMAFGIARLYRASDNVWMLLQGGGAAGVESITAGTNVTLTGTAADPIINVPFRGALLDNSVAQSIPNAVFTVINWDAETYDTDAFHDNSTNNSRITIPAGITRIKLSANMWFDADNTGSRRAEIIKNGSATAYDGQGVVTIDAISNTVPNIQLLETAPIIVIAGDFFELRVTQSSGAALDFESQEGGCWFGIEVIE